MVAECEKDLILVSLAHDMELFNNDINESNQLSLSSGLHAHHFVLSFKRSIGKSCHHLPDRTAVVLLEHLHVVLEFVVDAKLFIYSVADSVDDFFLLNPASPSLFFPVCDVLRDLVLVIIEVKS